MPSAKAKNGIITGMARPRKARMSRSRLPEDHADRERQDAAHQRLPREGRQAGDAQRHHGQEGAGFERHDRVGADIARAAVLAHQRHVEAAVGVVEGRHDGQRREARRSMPDGDGRFAEQVPEDHAEHARAMPIFTASSVPPFFRM